MCGIIGIFDKDAAAKALEGLKVIENRGKDGAGLYAGGRIQAAKKISELKTATVEFCLGHVLHSVVGAVPQPIKGKGILVANCEIYNWKELDRRHGLGAKNDSEVLLKMLDSVDDRHFVDVLEELDGVYAFAYHRDGKTILARDIIGEKPIWYCEKGFCSERKALEALGYEGIEELNPRELLVYGKSGAIEKTRREFFTTRPEHKAKATVVAQTQGLLIDAIAKRIPDARFGILFSGGIDSTFIAKICKDMGLDFTCYVAVLDEPGMDIPEDLVWATAAAEELGLELKVIKIRLADVEENLKKVVPLIEDNNVVKVGVGLTFYAACQQARKDGIKVIFSGLGSEEIFAGYERHKGAKDVNDECLSGIRKIYERDLYRDDVISMNNNLELRLPFLDVKLVDYALKIPAKWKLDEKQNKKILREIAEDMGLPKKYCQRKKRAAQYGSKTDKAIGKLAAKKGFKLKSEYLKQFYNRGNPRLGVLFSGGKDSVYALYVMQKQNYPIACLITMKSSNPDSYMFHTPNIDLTALQAKALGIPLITVETEGEKEKELVQLKDAIEKARQEYGVQGIVTGALYSQYQRERIEKICDQLGLKIFSPLWHMDQEKEMRSLVKEGFTVIMSSIAAEGLGEKWLGKRLAAKDIDALVKLHEKIGFHVAGEGGEFESLVLDGPNFAKSIEITKAEIKMEKENTGRYKIRSAKLKKKT